MALMVELSAASPYSILPNRDKPCRYRAMPIVSVRALSSLTRPQAGDKLRISVPGSGIGIVERVERDGLACLRALPDQKAAVCPIVPESSCRGECAAMLKPVLSFTIAAVLCLGVAPKPAGAASQVLGVVASNGLPVPLLCVDGTCSGHFSAFCLQEQRP